MSIRRGPVRRIGEDQNKEAPMRKIVTAAFVSLDGVMQAPGGPTEDTSGGFTLGGWTFPLFDDVAGAAIGELLAEPYDLLLGRTTYDIFASYWPHQPADGPNAGIAEQFNRVTKYVATHRPESLTWKNSQGLGPDVVGRLRELKSMTGPRLLTQGSSGLIQTLLKYDLIDEVHVMIFPVTLGKGKRLFGEGTQPGAFKLMTSRSSPSGVILGRYARAGEVQTGSF
jgi:dihydrofolate reductase